MKSFEIENYFIEPEKYWPASHGRNVKKLKRFIESGCGSANQDVAERYIRQIVTLANIRLRFDPEHVYIVNAGSSGSHWLEAMLSLLPGVHNGGEIYLPKEVIRNLSDIKSEDAQVFLDALYLMHAGGIYHDSLTAKVTNSAHLPNHESLSSISRSKKVILLLRNPVDIVISRTFRKDEYKKDVASELSDMQYLERNCNYIKNFIEKIRLSNFDTIIKYETMRENPFDELKGLSEFLGLNSSDIELRNAIEQTSEKAVKSSVKKGTPPLTNVFMGERVEIGWAKEYAVEALKSSASSIGYEL